MEYGLETLDMFSQGGLESVAIILFIGFMIWAIKLALE